MTIMEIRVATAEDAGYIQSIYAPYVENTAVTFEYDVPGIEDFQRRITGTLKEYPYLAAVEQENFIPAISRSNGRHVHLRMPREYLTYIAP